VGFELTISAFERARAEDARDRSASANVSHYKHQHFHTMDCYWIRNSAVSWPERMRPKSAPLFLPQRNTRSRPFLSNLFIWRRLLRKARDTLSQRFSRRARRRFSVPCTTIVTAGHEPEHWHRRAADAATRRRCQNSNRLVKEPQIFTVSIWLPFFQTIRIRWRNILSWRVWSRISGFRSSSQWPRGKRQENALALPNTEIVR
jgi:hypothetical protein